MVNNTVNIFWPVAVGAFCETRKLGENIKSYLLCIDTNITYGRNLKLDLFPHLFCQYLPIVLYGEKLQ
jgi:hypothetical protein